MMKAYFSILTISFFLLCSCPLYKAVRDEMREVNLFIYRFDKITNNMKESEVINRFGTNYQRSDIFRLAQERLFEKEYLAAENSDSKYYLIWEVGTDHVFTIGFNKKRVVFKSHGGS